MQMLEDNIELTYETINEIQIKISFVFRSTRLL